MTRRTIVCCYLFLTRNDQRKWNFGEFNSWYSQVINYLPTNRRDIGQDDFVGNLDMLNQSFRGNKKMWEEFWSGCYLYRFLHNIRFEGHKDREYARIMTFLTAMKLSELH